MNMSFALTTEAMRQYKKLVTRRYGWNKAYCGQIIQAVEKAQGIPKGGHVVPIHEIQLLTPRWERLDLMIQDRGYGEREVIAEGFPDMTPNEFVEMLCEMNKKRADELVHRLEFRYLLSANSGGLRFEFEGAIHLIHPDSLTYQLSEDGTLMGSYQGNPDLSRYIQDTYRFFP